MSDRQASELDVLMARVAAGDQSSVEPLYLGLQGPARAFARSRLNNDSDVDDVVQRALLRLFEQAPRYQPDRRVLSWCFALVFWECRSERKRQERGRQRGDRLSDPALQGQLADPDQPEATVIGAEFEKAQTAFLDELNDEERALLDLDIEGATRELAHLSPATRRKRKQRLLQRLRDQWALIWKDGEL